MRFQIDTHFYQRLQLYQQVCRDHKLTESVSEAAAIMVDALGHGNKLLIFGNGGSAAEAQHFAAELVCKFEIQRKSLPALALTTDTSILTAQANDYGFETIFSRQIKGLGRKDDVAIGLTTSDFEILNNHSINIRNAFEAADKVGMKKIGLFGSRTKEMLKLVDVPIIVPSENTALVQEVHLCLIHTFCSLIEKTLFS